ncbi:nucleotidyltransferase family protein [Klebsiella pneumoniae]
MNESDSIEIFAPYGLADLFDGVIRPTPHCIGAKAAELKGQDFLAKCPVLTVASA